MRNVTSSMQNLKISIRARRQIMKLLFSILRWKLVFRWEFSPIFHRVHYNKFIRTSWKLRQRLKADCFILYRQAMARAMHKTISFCTTETNLFALNGSHGAKYLSVVRSNKGRQLWWKLYQLLSTFLNIQSFKNLHKCWKVFENWFKSCLPLNKKIACTHFETLFSVRVSMLHSFMRKVI